MSETTNKSKTAVSTRKVYQTTDYSELKVLDGNRSLNALHVTRLKQSIEAHGNLTETFPIKVNSKMEVIDGQHRLQALKELKLPAFYEIVGDLGIDETIMANSTTRNWSWRDFMDSHANRGNENYFRLRMLVEEYPMTVNIVMSYIKGERASIDHGFKVGNFQLSEATYTDARERLNNFIALSIAANNRSREFAYACLEFMRKPKYDQTRMEQRLEKFSKLLVGAYYASDYYDLLTEIYYRP